jgi:RNA polymerase sigma-70 factor (ECF subfamily)
MGGSEKRLLERAKDFDLQALAEIYDRYSPGLHRYAARLTGEPLVAEDCVAETFSRFLHALRARRGPESYLQAYLYRIAHNWISDYYRRQQPSSLSLDQGLNLPNDSDPGGEATANMQAQQVRAALYRLTSDQRQVIVLKFLQGWSNDEVAIALDKPIGAVKSLQHRALGALRRILLAPEFEDHETVA